MTDIFKSQIVLLGATGMLGRAWRRCLSKLGTSYLAPTRLDCNLANQDSVREYLAAHDFRAIINCAGYTGVDQAEAMQQEALSLNATACGTLAEVCKAKRALLVHYSTDYVFDGQSIFGYSEAAEPNPCNFYGKTKLLGEQLIRESGCQHLIVRTSWLYSHEGTNFVRTIAEKLLRSEPLRVVDDQVGRPTHVDSLASFSCRLASQSKYGTFNISDSGLCSWHEFAVEIRRQLRCSTTITACGSDSFKRAASRPAFSVLDLGKITKALGKPPHWTAGTKQTIQKIVDSNAEAARFHESSRHTQTVPPPALRIAPTTILRRGKAK